MTRYIGRSGRERSLIMSLHKVLGVDEILEILKHVRRIARRRWRAAVNVLGLVNVRSTLLTPIGRSRLRQLAISKCDGWVRIVRWS